VKGDCYPTVEHAYQAGKTLDLEARRRVRETETPAEAKRLGRTLEVRPDWEEIKLRLMRGLLRLKFQLPHLRAMLEATEDAPLVEENWWGDRFWGVCRDQGENWLGRLLMEIRDEIRQQQAPE
jgi:ribA/ribD-fused uncharacterized protein